MSEPELLEIGTAVEWWAGELQVLEDALRQRGVEYTFNATVATEYCWDGELRLVDEPNIRTGPDRGYTSYVAGQSCPEEAFCRCAADAMEWLLQRPRPTTRTPRWDDPR